MSAGLYKSDPRFAWLPVDATVLFFALSVLVGSFIIVRNPIHKKGLPVVFAMVCLVVWLWVTLMWSPSRIYGPDKVLQMATLVLWALIAGAVIIAPDPERIRRLFTMMLLLALLGGVDAMLAYAGSKGEVYGLEEVEGDYETRYLSLGRVVGPGALVALAGWLYARGQAARWLCLGLFLILCFALAIGGGRGPLLSTVLPCCFRSRSASASLGAAYGTGAPCSRCSCWCWWRLAVSRFTRPPAAKGWRRSLG